MLSKDRTPLNRFRLGATLIAASLFSSGTLRASPTYQFTTINDPLATTDTEAWAISGNSIVGFYRNASGEHGFLYNGNTYTTLDVPGSTDTSAMGISGNTIVGSYNDPQGISHGFICNVNSLASIITYDAPTPATSTKLVGISQNALDGASLVGAYASAFNQHGFLFQGTTFTTLDVPSRSFANAISVSLGHVVGYDVDDNNVFHGFLYNGTTYTPIDDPLAGTTTIGGSYALGISGSNIVGSYNDANGLAHGFLFNGLTYTTIDHPLGVGGTVILGIDGNNLVGYYMDAQSVGHGFLAVPMPQAFAAWESSHSVNNDVAATPWNDGVPDLLKYFLNIDPSRPMTASDRAALPHTTVTTRQGATYLALTYRQYQSLSHVAPVIQTSSDLVTWSNYTANPPATISTDSATGDPIMQVQVPLTGAETFVRFNVTLSP